MLGRLPFYFFIFAHPDDRQKGALLRLLSVFVIKVEGCLTANYTDLTFLCACRDTAIMKVLLFKLNIDLCSCFVFFLVPDLFIFLWGSFITCYLRPHLQGQRATVAAPAYW